MTKYKIQVTFKESEKELEDFLKNKVSASLYLKELALREMKLKPAVIDITKINEEELDNAEMILVDKDKKNMLKGLL